MSDKEKFEVFLEHKGTDTPVACPACDTTHPAKLIEAWWSGWSRYSEDVDAYCPTCCDCQECFIAAEYGTPSKHYPSL